MKNDTHFSTIDEYLTTLPDDKRALLSSVRAAIREAAPDAEEYIGYMMPAYKYHGPLVYFSAFAKHCSFFPGNSSLIARLSDELKPFKTAKGTISFTVDNPMPLELIKKIVRLRVAENEANALAKKEMARDKEVHDLNRYMSQLDYPLKTEVEALRNIIKSAHSALLERIKWNAPSYYVHETDLLTFNIKSEKEILLIFHNIKIVDIKSDILTGKFKDRRIAYFRNMEEIKQHKAELTRIIHAYVASVA
ncbi:MAG: DUF1801 domain-containing protein [Saprospiraceae bacterium]|nr:DUF1801 domain-containing protein [Saprospiraceae bacterium]